MGHSPLADRTTKTDRIIRRSRLAFGGAYMVAAATVLLKSFFEPLPAIGERLGAGALSLAFLGLGLVTIFGIPREFLPLNHLGRRAREFPKEPWKWRSDWARGVVENRGQFFRFVPWVIGGYVLLFTCPLLFQQGRAAFRQPPESMAMVLVGPCLGALILLYALLTHLRWRKYGVSSIELVTNPGVTGGWLRVILHSRLTLAASERLTATLKCTYSNQTPGDSEGNATYLIWRQNRCFGARDIEAGNGGYSKIPMAFYIPYDCESGLNYTWEVELDARVAGPNFHALFDVPVFKTPDSIVEVPADAVALLGKEVQVEKTYLKKSRARVVPLPGYGLKITTPTLRAPVIIVIALVIAVYLWMTLFDIFLSGRMGIAFLFVGLPIALPICLASTFVAAWLGLGRHEVTIDTESITIRQMILLFGRSAIVPVGSITGIGHESSFFTYGKPTSDVTLVAGARKYALSTGLPAGEARWLSSVIKSCLEETTGTSIPCFNDVETQDL